MSRRRKIVLATLVFGLAIVAWWVNRQLEPQRLTSTVLAQASEALGLRLEFQGTPDYAFRPEPRLLVPNLVLRDPASGQVILSAKRADVSLPWATITGGEPIITRIELDAPMLELPTLRRWLAARPPTPFKLPTLLRGVHVHDGRIRDDGYEISGFALDLPELHDRGAATLAASGRFHQGGTKLDFKTTVAVATSALESDFNFVADGSLLRAPKPLAYALKLDGHYRSDDAGFSLTATALDLDADSPLPSLRGKAQLLLAEPMQFSFAGLLRRWPKDWPALPPPVSEHATDLSARVDYRGARGLVDPIALHLEKDATVVDAHLRLQEVQDWIAAPAGSPLPPLAATAKTPTLDFDGIHLEGVEVELRPDEPVAPPP